MEKIKIHERKGNTVMKITFNYSVETGVKRVFKTCATLFMIVALAITMLAASGLGTNKVYAATSSDTTNTSTSTTTYMVTIRDNSKNNIIYITSASSVSADTIKTDIENYLKSKNKNIVNVSIDSGAEITVSAVSTSTAQASSASVTRALASAVATTAYSYTDAISALVSGNYIDITTVEKSSKVTVNAKYKTVYKKTSKLRKTVSKVKRSGKNATTTATTLVTKVNGVTTATSDTTYSKTKAVSKIVLKGTKTVTVRKSKNYSGTSGKAIVAYAKKFVGNPYSYGGTSLTHGCDCSGFVQSVYKHFGLKLPRINQYTVGKRVSLKHLKPGDLLSYSGHVAIYAGNGKIVHAVDYGQGIKVTSMYYGGTPYRATRIVK